MSELSPDELRDVAQHVANHPDDTAVDVLGGLALPPAAKPAVEELVASDDPLALVDDLADGSNTENPGSRDTGTEAEDTEAGTRDGTDSEPTRDGAEDTDHPVETETAGVWFDSEVSAPQSGVYPDDLDEREKWMGAVGKQAFAPWGDRDHPEAEPDKDARWKWGLEENHADGDTVDEWGEMDPRLNGRAFIQLESDPFAFVDGDDVRDPDTGAVHPGFRALLEHLGATYSDISTSGAGVHAYYKGELPVDGHNQAVFEIDTEPWGANDAPPTVEIYANTHLAITNGDHIPNSPLEVREWNAGALKPILEANGFTDEPEIHHDTDRDRPELDDYDPDAEAGEQADDIRDVLYAVDRLTPRDLPLRTKQVGDDSTGWEKWDPSSYRPSSGGDSLHRPQGEAVFHDHKHGEAFGVLSLFAAEQGIIRKPWDRLAGSDWWDAVDAARDAGAPIPEFEPGDAEEFDPADRDDLLELDVTLDPEVAWAAADAVTPTDVGKPLPGAVEPDGDAWTTPSSDDSLDVVTAVALAEGEIDDVDTHPSDRGYTRAYNRARTHYGAPLPKYLDATAAEDHMAYVFGAVDELRADHILDAVRSDITVENPPGDTVAKLNPTWEDSESGERIIAFNSGLFWCAKHETTFGPLQLVALEHGLVDGEAEALHGEAFKQAYAIAREEYGAPLPKWRATHYEQLPVLPRAVDVLPDAGATQDRLDDARDDTNDLLADIADVRDRAQLVTTLPGLGKTYNAVRTAGKRPAVYFCGRNELQEQAADYAREHGVSHYHLPVFTENPVYEPALNTAVRAVREFGKDLLRDADALLAAVDADLDDEDHDDTDDVDLPRKSCPTADGAHGDAWRLAFQTARALGYTPAEIHQQAAALFGENPPCEHDSADCPYSEAWDTVADPDAPIDLLIGSYGHAHVESARTHYGRDGDGRVEITPRTCYVDEFPGPDEYAARYGDTFVDHAVWLAGSLRDDVDNRDELLEADLWGDSWVRAWLDGDGTDVPAVGDAAARFRGAAAALRAVHNAEDLRDDLDGYTDRVDGVEALRDAVTGVLAVGDDLNSADLARLQQTIQHAHGALREETDRAYGNHDAEGRLGAAPGAIYGLLDDVEDRLLKPLGAAVANARDAAEARDGRELDDTPDLPLAPQGLDDDLPVAGDLAGLVAEAVTAARERRDAAGLLDAAAAALEGGRDGCRQLAAFANDGYAHPDAWRLLAGVAAPKDADGVTTVANPTDSFNTRDGRTHLKRVKHGAATILVDRDHRAAKVHNPPTFTARDGGTCPLVGLDATGRPRLWQLSLGRSFERRDIHTTDAERRGFLRDVMNTRVVQASSQIHTMNGNPEGKDLDSPLALLDAVADEYTGLPDTTQKYSGHGGTLQTDDPGVITTKKVRDYLGDTLEDRAGVVENYGNMVGSDALGDVNAGVIIGCGHYGDGVVGEWAALAGEEIDRAGHGTQLDYDSDVANTALRHMREDQVMQAILRFGRTGDPAVVFAYTAALRDDLAVVDEAAVVDAHSEATKAVVEAARQFRGQAFSRADVADELGDAYTDRTYQMVLANLAEGGYLRRRENVDGRASEYELEADPGLGAAELPDSGSVTPEQPGTGETKNPVQGHNYTWNFVSDPAKQGGDGVLAPSPALLPSPTTDEPAETGQTPS